MVSGILPLLLSFRKPLGGASPGGESAFEASRAQVRLRGTVYPETFPDFRRGGTLGRPQFPGFTHVLAALQGRPLWSPVHRRSGVSGRPHPTVLSKTVWDFRKGAPWGSRQNSHRYGWLRKLRRSSGTVPEANFAHAGPPVGPDGTAPGTPGFARRDSRGTSQKGSP